MTAHDVITKLREKFAPPEYAFLEQVRNGTGFAKGVVRTADAIALSLYPSRGINLYGFEVKVSRSDWLTELVQPCKANEIAQYCDFFALAVSDAKIVATGELPSAWGLIVIKKEKAVWVKSAEKIESKPLDKLFVAAITRKIQLQVSDEARIRREVRIEVDKERAEIRHEVEREYKHVQNRLETLEKSLAEFEKISGIKINSWNFGNIAAAVNSVFSDSHLTDRLKRIGRDALQISRECDSSLIALSNFITTPSTAPCEPSANTKEISFSNAPK